MNKLYYEWRCILWIIITFLVISCKSLSTMSITDVSIDPARYAKLPDQVIDQLGVWAFQIWLKTVKISQNSKDQALVEMVAKKIIKAAKTSDQFQWEVVLIENSKPDAICFPGGKIGVNTGLLDFTDRSEDWLAVTIGHEVVHVLARDAAERIDEELKGVLITAVTGDKLRKEGLSPEATAAVMTAMGVLWQGTVVFPFSRSDESQADKAGLILMARAGYNPAETITFWEEMKTRSKGNQLPEFLSTHPHDETRIDNVKSFLPMTLKFIPNKGS